MTMVEPEQFFTKEELESMTRVHRNKIATKGRYVKKEKPRKELWVLQCLKRQPSNIGMLASYADTDHRTVRQLITNLRKQGHHINLEDYGQFYHYKGYKP